MFIRAILSLVKKKVAIQTSASIIVGKLRIILGKFIVVCLGWLVRATEIKEVTA